MDEKYTVRIAVEYSTSVDEDARQAGESTTRTTTILFKEWTLMDLAIFAAETVKIRQLQTRIRKGEKIPDEYEATKPGVRSGRTAMTPIQALEKAFGHEMAVKLVNKFGSVEAAAKAMEAMLEE